MKKLLLLTILLLSVSASAGWFTTTYQVVVGKTLSGTPWIAYETSNKSEAINKASKLLNTGNYRSVSVGTNCRLQSGTIFICSEIIWRQCPGCN